ncbi:MAG TPA: VanZ family protein [Daejeonella sp.]|nr:VanZ family protein [Daejeonella sp.]
MFKTIKYQSLAILWALVVLILCDMPMSGNTGISVFPGFDKLAHTGFFFVLTVLLFYGKIKQQNSYSYRFETILKIVLVNVVLGGGIELLQLTIFTYRSAEWWDFFADMVGAGMGIFSYVLLHIRFNEPAA